VKKESYEKELKEANRERKKSGKQRKSQALDGKREKTRA
jgi:hypothetical protein